MEIDDLKKCRVCDLLGDLPAGGLLLLWIVFKVYWAIGDDQVWDKLNWEMRKKGINPLPAWEFLLSILPKDERGHSFEVIMRLVMEIVSGESEEVLQHILGKNSYP